MSPFGEFHARNRIARIQEPKIGRHVRLRACVGLYIGVIGSEQTLRPLSS